MTDAGPGASGQTGGSPEPGGKGSGGSPEPGDKGSGATGTTYTQEQVDAFLAEERRRTQSKYGDYDETKKRLADIEAANQTELERAQTAQKDSDARAAAATERANRLVVRSAVTAAAARAGALDPDVVVALLADGVPLDADGNVEGDVDKIVTKLLDDKPYLRGNGARPVGSADGGVHGTGTPRAETPNQQMDAALRGTTGTRR